MVKSEFDARCCYAVVAAAVALATNFSVVVVDVVVVYLLVESFHDWKLSRFD